MGVILEELRKFGIHLTLAQQAIGKGMGDDLAEAVLTNTAIKITGKNSETNLAKFAKQTGAGMDELMKLGAARGRFCVHSDGKSPITVTIASHRIDDAEATSKEEWNETLSDQIARFYVPRAKGESRPSWLEENPSVPKPGPKGFQGKIPSADPHGPKFPIDED